MKVNMPNKKILSSWEIECTKIQKILDENSLASEANVCAILWKNPDYYNAYESLSLDDFQNNCWKVFFEIGRQIIRDEKKTTLDELTVSFYLTKHEKLKTRFDEYGGIETIKRAKEYVNTSNIEGYIKDLYKFKTLKTMAKLGFPVAKDISKYMDMDLEQIYQTFEAMLNHVFLKTATSSKSYNVADGIYEFIENLDNGKNVGLPLDNSELLSQQISGIQKGHIYMLGMSSGSGKSFLMCRWLLPSIIKNKEKICIIMNEEDQTRIQTELLIYFANVVLGGNIHKISLRNGSFDKNTKDILYKAAEKIQKLKDESTITIIPLESYNVDTAIKYIKKFAALGCSYFILDTLKLGNTSSNEDKSWLSLQTDAVKLYDVIKPAGKNVSLFMTMQLGKQSLNQRYLNSYSIGISKNVVDVVSCCLLARMVHPDEREGQKNSIKCFKVDENSVETPFELESDPKKSYLLIFITKNRFGYANTYQIVAEVDFGTNKYKEIGFAKIMPDF